MFLITYYKITHYYNNGFEEDIYIYIYIYINWNNDSIIQLQRRWSITDANMVYQQYVCCKFSYYDFLTVIGL